MKQKISIKHDDSDDDSAGGGNNDGFAVMENEFYPDEEDQGPKLSPEEEKKAADERKKQKKLEQLDKKIKKLSKKHEKEKTSLRVASEIKNKRKRQEVVILQKMAQKQTKLIEKLKKKKVRGEEGEEAMPKGVTKTIESMRVADETLIAEGDDEEIKGDQEIDEFSKYFKNETTPKILMTTNRRPKGGIFDFLKEVKDAIPNTEYYERKNFRIKQVIEWAIKRDYTDILVFYEKHDTLIQSHLPDGPTATFRVSGVKLRKEIYHHAVPSSYNPELILNNFDTMLGHRIGRMLASMYPQSPNFHGRRVVTFHNQRDFIFFRQHRYEFTEDHQRANLQEIGPRFTLKLHALQLGTLDTKFGEFEYIFKPKMGVNRKQFYM
ncbi:ribosome production factor 1 [Stylonychia lemnae]|uniref:Ribosome production factor 1 n=1 Tax=Stylonychia lemnae TaxID=5949 RepID=A0A078A0M5_STYLE|nr:ribosome production factor 1 [Stylonychia lemnae]|eukprot:CDW75412.1 ribosome production factor 1 [Stylonychia lemnae]